MTPVLRALMVEDSEDDSILIQEALRSAGYDVRALRVETEEALRQALRDASWDIVLSDYCLPSFNAQGTLEVVKETGLDLPVIVISGTVGEDVAVETLKHGAEDYLLKQNLTRLFPAVKRALDVAESRRRQSRLERMRTIILENSPDLIVTLDQQGRFLEVSAASKELLGYEPAELEGVYLGELTHPDDLARTEKEFRAVLGGCPSRNFEKRCRHKSGRMVNFLWSAALSPADGVVVGIGRDITKRKQQEEALRRGEENIRRERALLRALIDSIPDLIFFKDKNFHYLGCNQACANYLGVPEDQLVGKSDFDIMPAEFAPRYRKWDEKLFASGRTQHFEEEVRGSDGSIGVFDTIKAPFYGPDGELLGLLGVTRDITERKRQDEALREERDFSDTVLSGLPGIFYHFEAGGRFLRWNQNFERVTGYSAEELAAMGALDFFAEEEKALVVGRIAEVYKKGAVEVEANLLLKDGRRIPYLFTGVRFDQNGRKGFIGVALDISWRKRIEEALREKTALFEAQVESSITGLHVVDRDGKKVIQNQRLNEIWKLPPDLAADPHVASQRQFAAQRTKNPDAFLAKIAWLEAHPDEISRNEIELTDGTIVDLYSSPVRDKEGRYYGRMWIHRDITEQRRAEAQQAVLEAQLRQNQKLEALGTLAGGIAHDFNNILTAIILNWELALMELHRPEALRRPLDEIGQASTRAKELVRQILTFSRRQKPERQRQCLHTIVIEAFGLVRASLPSTIGIEQEISPDTPAVLADAGQIHQVVMNLCTNAAHAMSDGPGRLTVRLEPCLLDEAACRTLADLRPGRYARITISDTGRGMEPAVLARVFEPFFTTKGPGEGTGLGLAMVHGIVKEHEGGIAVRSEPGAGTTFELYFPEAGEADGPVRTVETTIVSGHGELILVADDEQAICLVIGAMLRKIGYQVETYDDPREALERLRAAPEGTFHLLLTDRTMPHLSGPELVAQAHAIRPGLPALVMSGLNSPMDGAEPAADRAYGLLAKPIDIADLSHAVRQTLEAGRPPAADAPTIT